MKTLLVKSSSLDSISYSGTSRAILACVGTTYTIHRRNKCHLNSLVWESMSSTHDAIDMHDIPEA